MKAQARWLLVLICAAGVALGGCAAWQGARLYQSGTRALEAGDAATALTDLREAARLVPDASEVQNHLGLAWLANGDEVRAKASFERALELDCDNEAARVNLEQVEASPSPTAASSARE